MPACAGTPTGPHRRQQRCAEARQREPSRACGAEPREQRRLKELYRRASNELRQRHVAAVALENKATDIRKRQKRRKELKPQLTDLFSARRVPPELIQNILTFVGYDLVQADAPGYDLMREDPREVDPSALKIPPGEYASQRSTSLWVCGGHTVCRGS